jgi:hypothetical protein
MFPRSVRREGPVGFHPSFARVCALEVLRNGNDGHIQATADRGGDVFERHTLFGDGVIAGSRCALL